MAEYKATGRQLEVPLEARGMLFRDWSEKQSLVDPGELRKWLREQKEIEARAEKSQKKKSGAVEGPRKESR